MAPGTVYQRINYVSTSNVNCYCSADGVAWYQLTTAGSVAFTPTALGIMGDCENSEKLYVGCQFFRVG